MSKKEKFPVNLPKTDFDMRAGLVEKEPKILAKWASIDLYNKKLQTRNNAQKFILHDGPPYANGNIHVGTALNKILKDIICRYRYSQGYQTPFIPGWDCHGLPIELNTLKSLGIEAQKLNDIELREKCRAYAWNFVEKQKASFIRLGVDGDWQHPYLTMSNQYEASIMKAFGILVGKGYIYRGERPIYWSPVSRTALADAEVEYQEHTSPAIYVLFPVENKQDTYVVIWTTTPWTLPANAAVAFHPEAEYVELTLQNGRKIIIADPLKEAVLNANNTQAVSSSKLEKKDIEALKVKHPWIDRESVVVFADYVTMDTGTGIVHTAPGHGPDDFITGQKYNLPILSPIDDSGRFTKEVPEWEGEYIFDANPKIVEFLAGKGLIWHASIIKHSYPHDWRAKTPLIFRTKPQWFFRVSDPSLTQQALNALPAVQWTPRWGEERLKNMLINRPDWCISRQRKWGVPIPAFYCSHCDNILINEEIISQIAEKVETNGLEYWLGNSANTILEEILGTVPLCKCGNNIFKKEEDILDVWFDSGTSHFAVLDLNPELNCPADLYLEGSDQYRGWFQASLWNSMALHNYPSFKSILTHGWVLDEEGRQMHKSLGNTVAPEEITEKFGADILRLWVVTEDFTKDLRIGKNIIQKTIDLYRKLRNTFRYMLGNLYHFTENDILDYSHLEPLDQYMLHKLYLLRETTDKFMEKYQFHRAYREIFNFCIIELSSQYFDILKDRLYILAPHSAQRLSAQTVLFYILKELMTMLSPVLVFTMEEVYDHAEFNNKLESIHLLSRSSLPKEWENKKLTEIFSILDYIREEAQLELQKLRDQGIIGSSLEAGIILETSNIEMLEEYQDTISEMLMVSELELKQNDSRELIHIKNQYQEISHPKIFISVFKSNKTRCERCWHHKDDVNMQGLCLRCQENIINQS